MAKFSGYEISVEIEKLKIYVKGDREIAPEIATNVANQVSGMFQPAALIEGPSEPPNGYHVISAGTTSARSRRTRKRSAGRPGAANNGGAVADLDWNHDVTRYGTPLQSWTQPQKVTWLLYVVELEGVRTDGLTPTEMEDIFQRKFKAAGLLNRKNIGRDLGKSNLQCFGALNGKWYLKDEGKKEATKLIAEAKGGTVAA